MLPVHRLPWKIGFEFIGVFNNGNTDKRLCHTRFEDNFWCVVDEHGNYCFKDLLGWYELNNNHQAQG